MLSVTDCVVQYGGSLAVRGVSLHVRPGECLGLIGPNGAGKSSLLKATVGLVDMASGQVVLEGRDVTGLPTEQRVRAGIALVPEGRGVLGSLTVAENLRLGLFPLPASQRTPAQEAKAYEYIFDLFPRLRDRLGQRAGTLSGGESQMLAIARALMSKPRVLLLDEPTLGLAPHVGLALSATFRSLREQGLTMIIVEQKLPLLLHVCDRLIVMRQGRFVLEGMPGEIARHDLRDLYFAPSTNASGSPGRDRAGVIREVN